MEFGGNTRRELPAKLGLGIRPIYRLNPVGIGGSSPIPHLTVGHSRSRARAATGRVPAPDGVPRAGVLATQVWRKAVTGRAGVGYAECRSTLVRFDLTFL